MMIDCGICFLGFSILSEKVQMTSNPSKLKMITEINDRLCKSKLGSNDAKV